MRLEEALKDHEARVDALIKANAKYASTLKAWKKSCQKGQVNDRQRSASAAEEMARQFPDATAEAAASWDFDVRAYLESDAWRQELEQIAREAFGLKLLEEEDRLVSPPILVRAQPGLSRLQLGKTAWPTIHPRVTAAHLKRLNEQSTSATAAQQFLNALYDAARKISQQNNLYARFRDLYDLFAFAPGWGRENSPTAFAQQIHALVRSGVRSTRDGKTFEIEFPSGKPKDRDIFSVIAEDGRQVRYYGIWFR